MGYNGLQECVSDLEKNGHLVRVKEEVNPDLEMAAIHLRVHQAEGPAILFENVKGSEFQCVSNLFGTLDRSRFIFRDSLEKVKKLVELKRDPLQALRSPFSHFHLLNALPKKSGFPNSKWRKCQISDLPQIKCWPNDGGPFITLPQVYTEDINHPGVMKSNLGMYRIQLGGNDYIRDEEIGLHYQIHRGIGVHQSIANAQDKPLKVSVFVGGPPSHSFAAVMPLPEGLSELTFAGALGGRRFRYARKNGFAYSTDADFIITGEVMPNKNKPEGPFGDHLGYYSLKHDFPVMKVNEVWARKGGVWPFTVVGRPPQEDTQFGALIHEITGPVIPSEIPGLHEVNAVDAAGVHPLLFAIGSERYTPYLKEKRPQEVLTIANHILGFGQMSLAKYLFIIAKEDNPSLTTHDMQAYLIHVLQRVDWSKDLHFYTNTTIDTLDYSGTGLNSGSKVVIAAVGDKKQDLLTEIPTQLALPSGFSEAKIVLPGVVAIAGLTYSNPEEIVELEKQLINLPQGIKLVVICDDANFVAASLNNFLWVTFTRSNPSHDIHGVKSFYDYKHWGCNGPLIIDARIKPYHAPVLEENPMIQKQVDKLGFSGASLHGII